MLIKLQRSHGEPVTLRTSHTTLFGPFRTNLALEVRRYGLLAPSSGFCGRIGRARLCASAGTDGEWATAVRSQSLFSQAAIRAS